MEFVVLEDSAAIYNCIYNAEDAVVRNPEDLQAAIRIFRRIWQRWNVKSYECPYCIYKYVGRHNDYLFSNVGPLKMAGKIELMTGEVLPVNKKNFSICCPLERCIFEDVPVTMYPNKKEED